jgi:hypothetical protein
LSCPIPMVSGAMKTSSAFPGLVSKQHCKCRPLLLAFRSQARRSPSAAKAA